MPQLTFRGVHPDRLMPVSSSLVEELAGICGCGPGEFTLDVLSITSIGNGGLVPVYPFVEVAWFERGTAVRDAFAATVAGHLREAGVPEMEIAFKVYEPDAYYINGVTCAK
ncbi:DUF1904 family protein [Paenibacillus aurantius]|uniref:DUF1904 family protein n=1 Tax=Paenibacillus aurantius TaxID=2918900 RepID=A0AA96L983_9BACL|nr:DUF1904 family protein [Paenibacillus aurantius]WNQ09078.1 DUF1904 family protein [Paenibacillus aurantius]